MRHLFVLLAAGMMACFTCSVSAEPADPVLDSLLTTPEEVYDADAYTRELIKAYGGEENEQFQKMQKQIHRYEKQAAATRAKRTNERRLILVISLLMALFPACVILVRVIKGELKPANTRAIWRTVGLLLFYGMVIFALNYVWLWTMIRGETKVMEIVIGLCLLAFVIYAIHTLRKSPKI